MASDNRVLVIDNDLRTIKIPRDVTNLGVEFDDGVLGIQFEMPRKYNGIDLSDFEIRINYLNAEGKGDSGKITRKMIVGNNIVFTWYVSRFATARKGHVTFNVCLKKFDGSIVVKEFNTTPATLPVLEGLETTEQLKQDYPDLIKKWHEEILGRFTGEIDTSLTVSGKAADAAVTGNKIDLLSQSVGNKASKTELITERQRIDSLIASEENINPNSELLDIRVGADGTAYANAGNAVREQIKKVRSAIFAENSRTYYDVEEGNGYLKDDGTLFKDVTWFTSDYIPVTKYSTIKYCLEEYPDLPHIVFYDAAGNVVSSIKGTEKSRLISNEVVVPENATSLRYVMYILDTVERRTSQYIYIVDDLVMTTRKELSILSDMLFDERNYLYSTEDVTNGYIRTDNVLISDDNWYSSDFIKVNEYDHLKYDLMGHKLVSSIVIYDRNKKPVSRVVGAENNKLTSGEFVVPKGGAYIRYVMSHMGHVTGETEQRLVITSFTWLNVLGFDTIPDEVQKDIIAPRCIYTVANDIGRKRGHNRNYSAALYLDHHFNNLTQEHQLRYDSGSDKKVFFSPVEVVDSNEDNPGVMYNKGLDIFENDVDIELMYNDRNCKSITVVHRSVLNSPTINNRPRILCIGDSITYGELAMSLEDGLSSNHAYHLLAAELFKKDLLDNNNSGEEPIFLGTMKRSRTMVYNSESYPIVTHHEGRRGWSYSTYMSEGSPFYDSETDTFSINKWLNDYRTMTDNGTRLGIGGGVGAKITSSNINDIDVCTPTHVLIMLGANGGQTAEQYQKMVNDIKSEYPDMIIALAVSDSAGTYFPSLHPTMGDEIAFWVDSNVGTQSGRHDTMYNCMKTLIDTFDNEEYESNDIYVLPFYFVQPTAESCCMREVPSLVPGFGTYVTKYGWCPTTHINNIGHASWAYQLYSWLKYTIAKSL